MKSLAAPFAAVVCCSILGTAISLYAALNYNSHRYTHVAGSSSQVLDSRTGCVWQMAAVPPSRRCPGDPAPPPPETLPADFNFSETGKASVDVQTPAAELTPGAFMKGQKGRVDIFDEVAKNRKPEAHTFSLDDIAEPNGGNKPQGQLSHVRKGIQSDAPVAEGIRTHDNANGQATAERARLITEFVLYLGGGLGAMLFALWPLLKKARSRLRPRHHGGPAS
ncbi:MAG TPA: hypothetical protein VH639_30020 [Bryobacteraceae bacterium]|jgi:hypothetical protein